MGKEALDTIVSIVTAIIGLAILAVILSRNSNTTGVIGVAAQGLAADIGAATSPITGGGGIGGMGGGLQMSSLGGGFGGGSFGGGGFGSTMVA